MYYSVSIRKGKGVFQLFASGFLSEEKAREWIEENWSNDYPSDQEGETWKVVQQLPQFNCDDSI